MIYPHGNAGAVDVDKIQTLRTDLTRHINQHDTEDGMPEQDIDVVHPHAAFIRPGGPAGLGDHSHSAKSSPPLCKLVWHLGRVT